MWRSDGKIDLVLAEPIASKAWQQKSTHNLITIEAIKLCGFILHGESIKTNRLTEIVQHFSLDFRTGTVNFTPDITGAS